MTVTKVAKNTIFLEKLNFYQPNLTVEFFGFHPQDLKPKRIRQIASNRAKTRSKPSQTCVKYRGSSIFLKRNMYVNSGDLKILHQKMSKIGVFFRHYL